MVLAFPVLGLAAETTDAAAKRSNRTAAFLDANTNPNSGLYSYLNRPDQWLKRQWSYHHDFDGQVFLVDPILNHRHALVENPGGEIFNGKEMIRAPRSFGPLMGLPPTIAASDAQMMTAVIALKGVGMEMDMLLWREIQRSTNAGIAQLKLRLREEQRRLQFLGTNGMLLPTQVVMSAVDRMRWRSLGPRSNAVFRMEAAQAEAKAHGMSALELQKAVRSGATNSYVAEYRAAERESYRISASNTSFMTGRQSFSNGSEEMIMECEAIRQEAPGRSGDLLAAIRSVDDARANLFEAIWGQNIRSRTEPPALTDIQNALPEKGVVVEFAYYQEIYKGGYPEYAVVIIAKTGTPVVLRLGRDIPIEKRISEFENMMRSDQSQEDEQVERMLSGLHQLLWQPIAAKLPPATRNIFLAVDGMLHRIPFAALRVDGSFLGDKLVFHHIPTARSLLWPPDEIVSNRRVEIWADPDLDRFPVPGTIGPVLATTNGPSPTANPSVSRKSFERIPGTGEESKKVKQITSEAGWQVVEHTGAYASEADLRTMSPPPYVLHLSTHGLVLGDPTSQLLPPANFLSHQPFHRHGLAFAGVNHTLASWKRGQIPAPASDGALLAAEVLDLDLPGTWLTVLSACDTGHGQVVDGEGVRGLGQAFLRAGSKNVLLSLWPLGDVYTSSFMAKYYQELIKGGSPTETMARVQARELNRLAKDSLWDGLRLAGPFVVISTGSVQ